MKAAALVVLNGSREGERIVLSRVGRQIIGRSDHCDIQILEEGVSRSHCAVEYRDGRFFVADLNSSNGTFINNQPVSLQPLAPGDRIQLGRAVLRVEEYTDTGVATSSGIMHPGSAVGETGSVGTRITTRQGMPPTLSRDQIRQVISREHSPGGEESGPVDLDSLRRDNRNLATIYKIANIINSVEDLAVVYRTVLEAIHDVTRGERAALLLRMGNSDILDVVSAWRRRNEQELSDLPLCQRIANDVLLSGTGVLIDNAMKSGRYRFHRSIMTQRIKSIMCAPISTRDSVLGVIYVDNLQAEAVFARQDMDLLTAISRQAGTAIHRLRLIKDMEDLFFGTIRTLVAAIDAKDQYTHGHTERVTAFAMKLGREQGLPERDIEVLQLGALLHDVGKIGVSERVLNKVGALTAEEYEEIRQHPVHGANMLAKIHHKDIQEIARIVRYHHEKWDGSGYPEGLRGESIPILARIVAVADAFDAMTTDRPYRKGFSPVRAAGIITEEAGSHFDPTLATVFTRMHENGVLVLPATMAKKYAVESGPGNGKGNGNGHGTPMGPPRPSTAPTPA